MDAVSVHSVAERVQYYGSQEDFPARFTLARSVNRRLGIYENLLEDGQRFHGYMINVNYLLVRSRKELNTTTIKETLKKLQRRIPALRLVISGMGSNKFFRECSNLKIDFDVLSTYDWKAVFEEQMKIKFPEGQPLWRVRLLKPDPSLPTDFYYYYPFLFTYNHAAVDGGSIMFGINKYFLDYLEEATRGKLDTPVDTLPFPQAREIVLPEAKTTDLGRVGWSSMFQCCGCFGLMSKKTNPYVDQLFRRYRPTRPVAANGLADFVLGVEETAAMIESCNRHEVRVNGFITAAVAVATYKFLMDYEIIQGGTATFDTAFLVNIRRFANPPITNEHVGLWNGFCDQKISLTEEATVVEMKPFWDLAKKCDSDVCNKIENGKHFLYGKILDSLYIKHGAEWLYEVDSLKKKQFFIVTNRGTFDSKANNEENPNVKLIRSHWGCADFMIGNNALFTHSLCSLHGSLQWSLSYSKLMVTKTSAREYADMIRSTLIQGSQC